MEMNLYEAIKDRKKYLPEKIVKIWMYQILKALDFMHRNGIFHRDIKPENILLRDNNVKLADLGSCKGVYSKPPFTEYISTRWYRSPECLLTDGYYNYKMDIWGLGCVFFEMLTLTPLFPGDDELDQVNKINQILGSPSDELFEKFVKNSAHRQDFNFEYQKGTGINKFLTHVSSQCVELIQKMLTYDPDLRYTAKQCISHPYFEDLVKQDEKVAKMNPLTYKGNSMLIISFNDSSSCLRMDDSLQNIPTNLNYNIKTLKPFKEHNASNSSIHNIQNNYPVINFNNVNGLSNTKIGAVLPEIKLKNSHENSKDDDSFSKGNKDSIKINDNYIRLPKIMMDKKKYWGEYGNLMNSNEFKKIKHNISNHSIDKGFGNANTQYEKKQTINIRKRIQEVKKYYVSPYSKKAIESNILI